VIVRRKVRRERAGEPELSLHGRPTIGPRFYPRPARWVHINDFDPEPDADALWRATYFLSRNGGGVVYFG
jgi:hypothetical protein